MWTAPRTHGALRSLGPCSPGVGVMVVASLVIETLSNLLGARALEGTLVRLTPRTVLELGVFLGTSRSAGFCEELVAFLTGHP